VGGACLWCAWVQALGHRPAGIGEGLLYGAETVAQGMARGARGVFERSKSGLDAAGPVGLLQRAGARRGGPLPAPPGGHAELRRSVRGRPGRLPHLLVRPGGAAPPPAPRALTPRHPGGPRILREVQ